MTKVKFRRPVLISEALFLGYQSLKYYSTFYFGPLLLTSSRSMNMSKKHRAELILFLVTTIWGYTFVLQRTAMEHLGPLTFLASRLVLAAMCLLPLSHKFSARQVNRKEIWIGVALGAILFFSMACQQIGLKYTTAGKAGFITGLYVLFVPMLLVLRQKISRLVWIGAALAALGLFLISGEKSLTLGFGDSWVLACAFLFSFHVIVIEYSAPKYDSLRLALLQTGVAAALCIVAASLLEAVTSADFLSAWREILFAGLISSGFCYTAQIFCQRHTTAINVALICSLESVFAGIAGWYFLSESMNNLQISGCALILVGTLLPQLALNRPFTDQLR